MMIATSSGLGRHKNIAEAVKKLDARPKGRLLLKPNLVAGGLAATHADAIRAVLENLDITCIAEGSTLDTEELYSMLGYRKLARDYGVELVDLNQTEEWNSRFRFRLIDGSEFWVRVSDYARRYEIVSLTLPKTHDHAIVTLTLKNLLGLVHPDDRILVHGYTLTVPKILKLAPLKKVASRFSTLMPIGRFYSATEVERAKYVLGAKAVHKNIASLAKFIAPKLGIIDGFVGMQGDGPVSGEPLEWNVAIAGEPIECDVYCAHKMGFDPAGIGYLHYLKAPSVDEIKVSGEGIPAKEFKPHSKYELQLLWKEI